MPSERERVKTSVVRGRKRRTVGRPEQSKHLHHSKPNRLCFGHQKNWGALLPHKRTPRDDEDSTTMDENGTESGSAQAATEGAKTYPRPLIVDKSDINVQPSTMRDLLWRPIKVGTNTYASIDELVFKVRFKSNNDGIAFKDLGDTVQCDERPTKNESNKPGNWRYSWAYRMDGATVWVGVGLVEGSGKTNMVRGKVKLNPNKTRDSFKVALLMRKVERFAKEIRLDRFDIALDMNVRKLDTRIRKDQRGYEYMDKGHGITEYLGTRGKPGRVKAYDKTREQRKRGVELDGEWTRVELTCSGDWTAEEIEGMWPVVYAWKPAEGMSGEEKGTTKALGLLLAIALDHGESVEFALAQLDRRMRKRVREYLESPVVGIGIETIGQLRDAAHGWMQAQLETQTEQQPMTEQMDL